jgi:hypothetical protein
MAEKFSTGDVQAAAAAIRTAYTNGVIGIFGGTQPATANDTEGAAPLLCLITINAGAFTGGVATNGINFAVAVDGVLSKEPAEVWKGLGTAAASTGTTATWFRHYGNAYTTGASTSAARYDGAITTAATAELQMTNQTVVQSVPVEISTYTRTIKRTA